jgi:Fe-S-cluster containining protein
MDSPEYKLTKELLPVPLDAAVVHTQIVIALNELDAACYSSCVEPAFRSRFTEILKLYDHYQQLVLQGSSMNISCKSGCSYCCYHWVEDVNSFEAEIIAEYIKEKKAYKVNKITRMCQNDLRELERLQHIVSERLDQPYDNLEAGEIDDVDLLLSVFYQMKRPCPLLDSNGSCMVYPVRPLTCRIYMSFTDPGHCSPEYINDDEVSTYLLNLEENANEILDKLHYRYSKFSDDTGLRSLLLQYLSR